MKKPVVQPLSTVSYEPRDLDNCAQTSNRAREQHYLEPCQIKSTASPPVVTPNREQENVAGNVELGASIDPLTWRIKKHN